jgi:hypothetical protein
VAGQVENMTKTIAGAWIEEGRVVGEVRALREGLRTSLERHFAPLSEALLTRINEVTDPQRLAAAIQQVWDLQKIEDLRL